MQKAEKAVELTVRRVKKAHKMKKTCKTEKMHRAEKVCRMKKTHKTEKKRVNKLKNKVSAILFILTQMKRKRT